MSTARATVVAVGAKQRLEVALDEEDPAARPGPRPGADPGGAAGAGRASPPRPARAQVVALGVVVAVLLGLVGAQTVVDARERDRLAALVGLPGVVADLSVAPGPVEPVAAGSTGAGSVDLDVTAHGADGLRVALRSSASEEVLGVSSSRTTLVGLDGDTVVWSRVLPDGSARGDGWWAEHPSCLPTPGDPATVTCLTGDAATRWRDSGEEHVQTWARVLVVAVADGRVVRERDLDLPAPRTLAATDTLVVEVVRHPGGATPVDVVTARDPVTWDERWSTPVPVPGAEHGFTGSPALRTSSRYVVVDGVVAVTVLAADDGAVLREPDGSAVTGWIGGAPGDDVDVLAFGAAGGTLLWSPEQQVEVDGQMLTPSVDDGSLGDLVLTSAGHDLVASDRDGTRRWRTADADAWDAVVVGGHLAVLDRDTLRGVDPRTGAVRWTRDVEDGATVVATDGHAVLLHESALLLGGVLDTDPSVDLAAFDLADGRELWRTTLDGVAGVRSLDGHLVGDRTDGSTVDLG